MKKNTVLIIKARRKAAPAGSQTLALWQVDQRGMDPEVAGPVLLLLLLLLLLPLLLVLLVLLLLLLLLLLRLLYYSYYYQSVT